MADKPWKRMERECAKEIGGERNPVSGRIRGYKGDAENEMLNVECKYRSRPLPNWLMEAIDQAEKAVTLSPKDQTPVVRIHVKNQRRDSDIVVMTWAAFKRFMPGADD